MIASKDSLGMTTEMIAMRYDITDNKPFIEWQIAMNLYKLYNMQVG